MTFRDAFRKFTGRAPSALDQVDMMVTRKLPIPGLEETGNAIEFIAKRDKEGFWTVTGVHKLKNVTAGLQTLADAYLAAIRKHAGQIWQHPENQKMNFDNALLVLRDLEDCVLAYTGKPAGKLPPLHYSTAEKLLPAAFVEGLESVLQTRTRAHGTLLAPKVAAQTPEPQPFKGGPAAPN